MPHGVHSLLHATWSGFTCPHQLALALSQHDFSLERKVLYWVEVASQQQTSRHRATSEVVPTAPPCWLLLVDPADTYGGRGRDGAVRRSISLSAADSSYGHAKDRATLSDTESDTWHSEEGEYSDDEYSSTSWEENDKDERLLSRRRSSGRSVSSRPGFYQTRPKTSPGLLEPSPDNNIHSPASPDPSKQRRSMVIFNNMKNELEAARRKLAALVHPLNRAATGSRGIPVPRLLPQCPGTNHSVKYGPGPDMSQVGTFVPTPPATAAPIPPIKWHKPTVPVSSFLWWPFVHCCKRREVEGIKLVSFGGGWPTKGTKMGLRKHWTHEELLKFSQELKKGFDFFTEVERSFLGAHLLALSKTSMFFPSRV